MGISVGLGRPDETDFNQRLRLLVVGDDADQNTRIQDLLGDDNEVLVRDSVSRMRRALREHDFDCVLLALAESGPDTIHTLDAVLSIVTDLPTIVLARSDDRSLALHAIQEGAQDFLLDGDADAVDRAVRHAIARKQTETQLARQALHDSLTGLPNRDLMLDRLNVALGRSRRRPTALALLFLDLDGFKTVNDSLGHEAGDAVLVEVARRLQRILRPGDTIARYGGDEFVILCEDLRGERQARRVAERARTAIAKPFAIHGRELRLEASVGLARAGRDQTSAQDLVREADVAMYQAKRRGSGVELYDVMAEVEIETRLRDAVENAGLRVHYQPVLTFADDALRSLEALVRWEHPDRGLLTPIDFLALAEEIGVIAEIDQWVLTEACAQLARWRGDGLVDDAVRVSVNASATSLHSPELAPAIEQALADAGLTPNSLELETTETALERDPTRAATALQALAGTGLKLCLDGFDAERSTLGALTSHSFNAIKISAATTDRALAAALGAARAAELETVVTRLETPGRVHSIKSLGCDAAQGYVLAPPASAEDTARWLTARKG